MNKLIIKQVGIVNITTGDNITIIAPVNIYGATLHDNVFVGPFVEIQKDVPV